MRSVELFAGAGGLAIGLGKAGFDPEAVLEWDRDACETIRQNQSRGTAHFGRASVYEGDAREFDYKDISGSVELVSGGPPCQPFSLGGKHKGHQDRRDLFPEAIRAVRELRPKAFMFENVKGLLRQSFATYFEYVLLRLTFPEIVQKRGEEWEDHCARLEQHQTSSARRQQKGGLTYNVVFQLLNAANYGVPQRRERVIIVGFRADLGIKWSFPKATHSQDALLRDQWVSGEYWDRHKVAKRDRPQLSPKYSGRVDRLRTVHAFDALKPWVTVRDTISDLPDPKSVTLRRGLLNHYLNPGARPYPGHTGSPLDEPAKTLKAGDHGVPGGENMLVRTDGSVRYFSIREAARLQTFPDNYEFFGAWSEAMRQLGNAVPVKLAEVVGKSVANSLGKGE